MGKKKKHDKNEETGTQKHTHIRIHEDAVNYLKEFNNMFVVAHSNPDMYVSNDIRHNWKPSRFLFGKIDVLRTGLQEGFVGPEDKKEDFEKFIYCLKGRTGLFFTNKPKQEVLDWFKNYSEGVYAKPRTIATKDVVLNKGPHSEISSKIAGQLKEFGMPLTVVDGIYSLLKDHEICREGLLLSPQQCNILKMLKIPIIEKTFCVLGSFNNEDGFEQY